jgi:dTDP-4-dehydrorhamnose reductase
MYDQISIPTLKAVTTDEYPTLAKRPKFSVLDNKKIQENFDIFSSDWKVGIDSSLKKVDKVSCI